MRIYPIRALRKLTESEVKKKKETFNTYICEFSWGQLNAVYSALEKDHSDPLADELFAELGWYLQNVPGPGEDENAYKEAREAEKQQSEAGDEAAVTDAELLGKEVQGPEDADAEGTEPPVPAEDPSAEEADRLLEKPPERETVEA